MITFRFLRYSIAVMQRQLEQSNNNLLVVVKLVLFFKIKLRYILTG
ncbi:MAG: Rpn family recombination-promoting nuclease/putative transposase [Arsenophonus sp. NC-PG7-MAG3]